MPNPLHLLFGRICLEQATALVAVRQLSSDIIFVVYYLPIYFFYQIVNLLEKSSVGTELVQILNEQFRPKKGTRGAKKLLRRKKSIFPHVTTCLINMIIYYFFPYWDLVLFTFHTGEHLSNYDYCYLKNSSVTYLSQPVQILFQKLPLKFAGHKHDRSGSISLQGEMKQYCSLILQIRT